MSLTTASAGNLAAVANLSAANNKPTVSTPATSGLDTLSSDFNSFIKLLTAQLQHQDPTNPTDTNEFTNQIVAFSQVQQQVNINTNLQKLINLQKESAVGNSVSYIDKFVEAQTDKFNISGRKTILSYNLPAEAASAVVSVTDLLGNVVASFDGSKLNGKNVLSWDGKDQAGNVMEEGYYNFAVDAKNSAGGTIIATDLEHRKQPGTSIISYDLANPAQDVTVSITNDVGVVIANFDGGKAKGENKISWDGKDFNGNIVPDGQYKFSVKATDDKGNPVTAKTYTTGLVTQVDLQGDSTTLYLDKIQVDLDNVKSIKSGYAQI